MRSGTAAGVRARGLTSRPRARRAPRTMAGSPATPPTCCASSGWASTIIAQLDLEGAHSALPIWTEFMKRALQYRAYRNAQPFEAPDGIVSVQIDPESGMLATPYCPTTMSRSLHIRHAAGDVVPAARPRDRMRTHVAGWEIPGSPPAGQPGRWSAAPHVDVPTPPALTARRPPPVPGLRSLRYRPPRRR